MRTLEELWNTKEDLHPELLPYLTSGGVLGKMLRAPLVYDVLYDPFRNAVLNEQYKWKKEATAQALAEKRVHRFVFFHERPHRVNAFQEYVAKHRLTPRQTGAILREIWIDTENVWQHLPFWEKTFRQLQSVNHAQFFMEAKDRRKLASLPEQVTVYRGCTKQNRNGLSWTLDRAKAAWFANRFRQDGKVVERTVNKQDIFAVLLGRNEQEVILLPKNKKRKLQPNGAKCV